ncbi:egl nine homolog 1-like [Anneissia japonica]|uniref:egl nine homolog 1-like n=1 Tax=Anneissia japonica TaxID=1529436 RepID=UPI001425730C|nr:egl nine homolog 1-like [Anneissia japonica]
MIVACRSRVSCLHCVGWEMDMAFHMPRIGVRDTGNDSNDELNNVCAVDICNAISNLRMCGKCKSVRYCCKEHQKLDWKKHKTVCLKKSNAGSSATTKPQQAGDPEDALRKPPPTSNTTAAMTSPKVLFSLGDTNEPNDRSARTTTITGTDEQYTVQSSTNGLGRTHGSTSSNSTSSLLSRSSSGVSSCSSLDTAFQHLQSTIDEDPEGPRRIPSDLQSKLQQESAIFSERLGSGYPLKPFESNKGFGNMPPLQEDNISNGDCLPGENIKLHDLVKRVVKSLTTQHGICVLDNFLDERRGLAILKEVQQMHSSGQFQDGQVVRSRDDDSRKIRGDQIAWRNGHEPDCENISFLISVLDSILALCNGKLENYDINGRTKVSLPGVIMQNIKKKVIKNGGLLKVYPEGASGPASVAPLFNRLLFFYSDRRNPHEVFPAYATRFAITVWYLDGNQKSTIKRPVKI